MVWRNAAGEVVTGDGRSCMLEYLLVSVHGIDHFMPAPLLSNGPLKIAWHINYITYCRYKIVGTDLVIGQTSWADMGRWRAAMCQFGIITTCASTGSRALPRMVLEWT